MRLQPDAKDRVTGMVIGDGMFLTPHEIAQMRSVPELVFINCCHLGRIAGAAPDRAECCAMTTTDSPQTLPRNSSAWACVR